MELRSLRQAQEAKFHNRGDKMMKEIRGPGQPWWRWLFPRPIDWVTLFLYAAVLAVYNNFVILGIYQIERPWLGNLAILLEDMAVFTDSAVSRWISINNRIIKGIGVTIVGSRMVWKWNDRISLRESSQSRVIES